MHGALVSLLAAVSLIVPAAIPAGVDTEGTATVGRDGTASVSLQVTIDSATSTKYNLTCERIRKDIESNYSQLSDLKAETKTTDSKDLTCAFTGKVAPNGDVDIDVTAKKAVVTVSSLDDLPEPYLGDQSSFALKVVMPYPVTSAAPEGATVADKTLTLTSLDQVKNLNVVAEPGTTAGPATENAGQGTKITDEDAEKQSGWERNKNLVIIGAVIVVALVIGGVAGRHRRRK
ncbi:MAG: hypothetical protein E7A79_06650 [Actinomycetaceae bacterium]|nr:hypothetical protein [Actinomycetaceae bacterium]